jgi:hypothetical protein
MCFIRVESRALDSVTRPKPWQRDSKSPASSAIWPDGRVELIAEGLKDELEGFQQAIRESGLGSLIGREDVAWEDRANDFRGFEITR